MTELTAEYDAAVALLRADGIEVSDALRYDDRGDLVRTSYLIAFPTIPTDLAQARATAPVDFEHGARTARIDVQAISPQAARAAKLLARALGVLVGKTPAVEGRRTDPIRFLLSTNVADDSTIMPPVFYADGSVEITTRPGGTS